MTSSKYKTCVFSESLEIIGMAATHSNTAIRKTVSNFLFIYAVQLILEMMSHYVLVWHVKYLLVN